MGLAWTVLARSVGGQDQVTAAASRDQEARLSELKAPCTRSSEEKCLRPNTELHQPWKPGILQTYCPCKGCPNPWLFATRTSHIAVCPKPSDREASGRCSGLPSRGQDPCSACIPGKGKAEAGMGHTGLLRWPPHPWHCASPGAAPGSWGYPRIATVKAGDGAFLTIGRKMSRGGRVPTCPPFLSL